MLAVSELRTVDDGVGGLQVEKPDASAGTDTVVESVNDGAVNERQWRLGSWHGFRR